MSDISDDFILALFQAVMHSMSIEEMILDILPNLTKMNRGQAEIIERTKVIHQTRVAALETALNIEMARETARLASA